MTMNSHLPILKTKQGSSAFKIRPMPNQFTMGDPMGDPPVMTDQIYYLGSGVKNFEVGEFSHTTAIHADCESKLDKVYTTVVTNLA